MATLPPHLIAPPMGNRPSPAAVGYAAPATTPTTSASLEAPVGISQEELIKSYREKGNQWKRVQEHLQRLAEKKVDFLNHCRRLTEIFQDDEQLEEDERDVKEQLQNGFPGARDALDYIAERRHKREERKTEQWRFRNQLMNSEWLLEKPQDFKENWMMVPIPAGNRNLVISSGGQTSTYSKNGMGISQFNSHLPGGSKHNHKWNFESAVLDCIYNDTTKTYYILDMMMWRQTPMYDTETEFRFYWMHEKFLEVPQVATLSKQNPYRFEPLPNFCCDTENIKNVLDCEMSVPLDGLLFFHKKTHYILGSTPLVLWLRPHMIPEALQIMVNQKYIDRAPPGYRGFQQFKEGCIENLVSRIALDKVKSQKKRDKANARKEERMKAMGGDTQSAISHFQQTKFVSGGTMGSF